MKKLPERDEVQIAFWRVTEQITFAQEGCIRCIFDIQIRVFQVFEIVLP